MPSDRDKRQAITLENVSFAYPESDSNVFTDLSLTLPEGMVSFVGQNGSGKSTLLLLISGRVLPQKGDVILFDINTKDITDEAEKNRYASFIYQNMEFETEEPIGGLLEYVHQNGFSENIEPSFRKELIDVMELDPVLNKKTQEISKGQLQRTIIAFSLLYGSKTIVMDEPIFALETYQKDRIMGYLLEYARSEGVSIYYSAHELEMTRTYSTHMALFYKDGMISVGKTEEIYNPELLEQAYQTPFSMLKMKESIFRTDLLQISKEARKRLHESD